MNPMEYLPNSDFFYDCTVDGWKKIRLTRKYIVYPFIPLFTRVLYIPGGCLGFLIPSKIEWDLTNGPPR